MDNFKPSRSEKTIISIRIDNDMLSAIDKLARETDISRSQMVIQCIEYALKNSEKEG